MIHQPMSAQMAKIDMLRRDAAAGRLPLDRAPSRSGPMIRMRRSLGRLLVAVGDRLDDSRSLQPIPASDPCT